MKITNLEVGTTNLPDNSVVADDIATGAVTSGKIAAGAVIAGKIGYSAVKLYTVAGAAAPGARTTTGTKVGDKVLGVLGYVTSTGAWVALATANFEATVTVNDQIQQTGGGDLSANTYVFLVQPQS